MSKTMERVGINDLASNKDQLNRYELALEIIKDLKIDTTIDCACGVGYGTQLLSKQVNQIVGVDIDKDAIKISQKNNKAKNVKYICKSIFDLDNKPVDLFVSFETIEHVEDGDLFLKKIKSLLKKNGTLILSTPNGKVSSPWKGKPRNDYHIIEYFPEDLIALVSKYFKIEKIYGQYPNSTLSTLINVFNSYVLTNWLIHNLYKSLWRYYKTEDKPKVVNVTRETIFKNNYKYSTNLLIVAKNK